MHRHRQCIDDLAHESAGKIQGFVGFVASVGSCRLGLLFFSSPRLCRSSHAIQWPLELRAVLNAKG